MNLYLRFFWLLLTARFRPALSAATDPATLKLRVLPNDLDISLHLNNGRYLTMMDLGRMEYLLQSGLWRVVWKDRLTPIVSSVLIRFRRELRPFQSFDLRTQIIGWEAETVIFEQTFLFRKGRRKGQTAATALVRAGLYDRAIKAFVAIDDLIAATRLDVVRPDMSATQQAFLAAEDAMRSNGAPVRQAVRSDA
ncbi:MAG: thioesterase family protein [Pseudomonadota bacterium]